MSDDLNRGGDTIGCAACGKLAYAYDVVSYGSIDRGYRQLCTHCFNAEVASTLGLDDFENVQLHPMVLSDCAGERHEFHLRFQLLGSMVALDAFEVYDDVPTGYQFQVLGDPEDDALALLGRLVERMRRTLAVKYLVNDVRGPRIADETVGGRIESDEAEQGRVPVLVIDGREVSWEAFGEMLMTFEGWQFRLELRDRSEEP